MEKMTNKKALEFVLGLEVVVANEEVCQKLTKMLEQVEKKNKSTSADGKKVLSADQKKNLVIKDQIVEVMLGLEEPIQIKGLQEFEEFADYSNQKLSALVRQLVQEGTVVRIEEKRGVATFKVA